MSKEVLGFDANFLKQIKSLMEDTDIDELEIEEGENRYLRVSKRKAEMPAPVYVQHAAPAHHPAPQASAPAPVSHAAHHEAAKVAAAPAAGKYDDAKFHKVKSPVIGTYYECPSPDSPPFIKVGDQVSKDSTVCIVEAMKVMNEIKAEVKGKVVDILKTSGSAVQSGEVLVVVEKN